LGCECPGHNEHVKNFIRKYPWADGKFRIVDVEPEEWLVDLEHPEKNTAHCVLEDTKRVSSPDWKGQPASYNPFEWEVRY
jgi:hypothetical protein